MPSDQPPEPINPEPVPEPIPEPPVPPAEEPTETPVAAEQFAEEVSEPIQVSEPMSEVESEVGAEVAAAIDPEVSPIAPTRTRPSLPPDFVDETLPETGLRLLKQAVGSALGNAQPILKQATVKALRSTSAFLETTANRLEADPLEANSPETTQLAPTATVRTDRPAAVQTEPNLAEPIGETTPSRAIAPEESISQQLQGWWGSALSQVRARLPVALNQKLGDRALTGAIAGVLVVLFWTTSALLPSKSKPPAVAIAPPTVQPAPSPQPVPPQVKAPAAPQPVPVKPSPQPKPLPSPALQLSPEQKLIASIQDQVAEVSDRYSSSLIRSVQANFRSSRLVVKLGDSWYGLGETQQNKLSNELLKRAQQLDFVKLELSDPEGVLLARSPVVGTEMIILKRTTEAEEEETA
jgi:hypothetical protein